METKLRWGPGDQCERVAWACGVANSLAMSPVTLRLPRCGRHSVDHFLCEMPALIRMACVNTAAIEGTVFVLAVGPFPHL